MTSKIREITSFSEYVFDNIITAVIGFCFNYYYYFLLLVYIISITIALTIIIIVITIISNGNRTERSSIEGIS